MYRIAYIDVDDGAPLRCFSPSDLALHEGDDCIIEVDRVLDYGRVSKLETHADDFSIEQGMPKVLRCATLQDHAKADENALMSRMARDTCVSRAEKYGLKLRIVSLRYSFDRSALLVLFSAEERIDFREMVKELAGELRTRVEMKQIGVRDEAAIIGGVASCGRRLCCCSWLRRFEAINVKMVKAQGLSLNPNAISGMCGRLKCCLRYENDLYKELECAMPRDGSFVECHAGVGRVVDKDILSQTVRVKTEDNRIHHCKVADVRLTAPPGNKKRKGRYENPDHKRAESESAGKA